MCWVLIDDHDVLCQRNSRKMATLHYYCVKVAESFSFEKEKIHYSNSYNGLTKVLMQIGVLINLTNFFNIDKLSLESTMSSETNMQYIILLVAFSFVEF